MEAQDKIDTSTYNALKLVRAFKRIIKLRDDEPDHSADKPGESFAGIEGIIHQNHLDRFWATWPPETAERRERGQEGYFASFIRESTLDLSPEIYAEPLKRLVGGLQDIQRLSHSYLEAGGAIDSVELRARTQEVLRALSRIRMEFGVTFGQRSVSQLLEIPDYEREADERDNKSPETSLIEKNRRIDRRKDVLQVLVAEISEDISDIRKVLGIDTPMVRVGIEPSTGVGTKR